MKTSYCERYGGPDVYQFLEVDTPKPKENEVLVKVYRAVVSPTDGNFRSGKPFISRLFSGLVKPKMKIHGEMFVGIIVEIGAQVTDFKANDLVYGTNGMKLGAYAEYIAVDIKNAIKKVPSDLDYKDVLPLLDGGITALPFLKELAEVKKDDVVLINGASGAVGSMAVMIAKHYQAHVIAVCSTKNVEVVLDLGADEVIDYKKEDFTKRLNHYHIIFDTVGKSTYGQSKKSLKSRGIYITTVPTLGVMLQSLFKKNKDKKRASFMAAGLRKAKVKIKDLVELENLLRSGELKPLHGKVYPLESLGEAQAYVETGHKIGNVTIEMIIEKENQK
ncbi:MAG: NAD(P)-dependent alcohol dehydrogenase [Acholeplasmataceae bacterium]|nr:NAD(P)-dependent alcohol dehydrogenase [Acholeplasmataceae bacterium]